ncbi:MAG: dihydrofolate reductase [Flavitalea sp.]
MVINLLVAAAENNVIGKDNKLLWNLPNDLAYFKNLTWGMPVIMGRKTFDSLGKPLKGRTNIIISRNPSKVEGAFYATHFSEAIGIAEKTDAKECFVIGGGQIFKEVMPGSDRIYVTRVHAEFEGDTFFPVIDPLIWTRVSALPFKPDEKHAYAYTFEVWEKNKPKL